MVEYVPNELTRSPKRREVSGFATPSSESDDADNQRLAERTYWNSIYDRGESTPKKAAAQQSRLRRLVTRLLPATYVDALSKGYAQTLIDTVAITPFFPTRADWRAIEIGSAPGHFLVDFWQRFGYEPFGVEYTEAGVAANRRLFTEHGIESNHVIHADFFAETFRQAHRGQYEVVFSVGFIEHFADVRDVVDRHVELLRDGGRLLIVIPNLRGANRLLANLFHPGLMALHNTAVMDKTRFQELFAEQPLQPLFQGYLGVFSTRLLNAEPHGWRCRLLPVAWRVGQVLDLAALLLLRGRHPESRWLSPYLVYVGTKTPNSRAADAASRR